MYNTSNSGTHDNHVVWQYSSFVTMVITMMSRDLIVLLIITSN